MGYLILAALLFTPSHAVATTTPVIQELTIEEKIEQEAIKRNYNPKRAVAIAKAESNLIPTAKSKTSSASGIFQFIKSTWNENCTGDVFNEDDNIKCAVRMLGEGGENHWNASRHVWGKVI